MRIDVGLPPCRELPCGAAAFFFAFCHPRLSSLPPGGKDDSPYQGEMSRRDKRGRGLAARPDG